MMTEGAIRFISQQRDTPFYLHLCHFAMHSPIETSPKLRKKFEEKKKAMGLSNAATKLDDHSHKTHKTHKLHRDSAEYADNNNKR